MSSVLSEIQRAYLPAFCGTTLIVFSTVRGIFVMNKSRYGIKGFKHPYEPWQDFDDKERAERSYRAYKANENQREWMGYSIPFVFAFATFVPRIPYVGEYAGTSLVILSAVYSYYNEKYAEAYAESTDARVVPFKRRTNAFKAIAFVAMGAMAYSSYLDFVKPILGL